MKSLKYGVFLILIIFLTDNPNGIPDGIPAEVYTKDIAQNALLLASFIPQQ